MSCKLFQIIYPMLFSKIRQQYNVKMYSYSRIAKNATNATNVCAHFPDGT